MALFLFSEEKGRGNYEVIVGGKDDFSDLSITPKSAALVDASAGLYGVLWLKDGAKHEKRIFPSGSVFDDAIGNAYLFIPPGYRLVPKGGLSTLGEVAANPDKPVFVDGYRVEAYVGLFSNNGNGLAVQRSHGALRAGSDELRFGGRILQPECWYHLAYCYQPSTQAGQGSVHFLVNGKNVQTIKEVKISDYTKQVADAADWRIGRQLRGSLAGLRVWKINRNADTISRERHGLPEVEVIAELMKDLIAKDRYSGSDMASLRGDLNTLIEQEKYSQTEVDAVLVTKVNALISQQPSAGAKLRVFRKEAEKLFSEIRHAQEIQGKVQLVLNDVEEIVRKGQEDAIAVEAELSAPPKESRLFKNVLNKLEVQRAQELEAAHQKAAAAKNLAEKRSQYKIAVARDQARRRVHLDAVDRMVFVRGGKVVVNDPALSTKENPLVFKVLKAGTDAYPLDFSIVKDSEGKTIYLIADSWNNAILLCKDKSGEDKLEIYGSISPDKRPDGYTPRTPQAVICDASGTHGEAESGGVVRKAVYWVEEDGSFYRYWDDGSAIESSERNQVVKLIDPIATGQYRSWDLTFYRNDSQQLLIWCNGWEIFELKAGPESTGTGPVDRSKIKLLVPHTLSPHPVAVATDPEGNLVWLDAQEERVRFLPRGAQLPIDLYAAPNPTRGLSVCRIPGGEKPITYVYWVSALRRTLEVPVLDTPGRYIDLWQNAKKPVPHGQHVPLVAVDEEEELEWIEAVELFRLPIPVQIRVSLEPDRGYLVKMKMKLNKTQEEIKELYSKYYKTFKLLNDDSSFNSSLTIELFRLSGSNKTEEFELPTGRWFDLEIHYQVKEVKWYYGRTRKEYTIIVKADDEILCRKEVGILTAYYPKFKLFETKSYTNFDSDLGELAEVTVIRTDDDKEVMYWSPYEERSVSYGWRNSSLSEPKKKVVDKAGNEGLKAFRKVIDFQQDSDGRLKFEPIRLDLRKGWTAAADLIWHGKAAGTYNHTCLYELATFENECRLICSLDADGSPVLVIFWNGQQVTPAFNFEGFPGRGLEIGKMHRLCWTYDPKGEIYTYIDGRPATKVQLSLAMEPKVWEHQSLGAPNPYQFDKRVDTAAVQAAKNLFEEPEVSFQSFNGWVARFGAWNTFEPAAITDWDKAAPYDPSWDRSLVTIQSRYRYLQAGRLDGKETAVTLFPLDMDGGLNITTKLDSRRAAYNLAQVELAAAEAHAVKLKEAAFREARADLARAEADLAATQQQTDKDLAVARQKKIMAEEAARFDKIQAHANAELKKRQGVREANGERESGRRQAESQEVAAADDKKRRIGEKAHERNQKRSERDKKRNEAEGHGLL
ncbi:MAG: hypothetical protein KDD19_14015 [Phaeodactylibacter sp.]|nr:hypothetical protein [Phaeodactylibacter sp.]